MTDSGIVTAGLLIIGEEILSGRTQDKNIGFIAKTLDAAGIALREVRVIPDLDDEIVEAVNAMRRRYRYVLSTGGIGPTHDDVTTDAIGHAFGVEVVEDPVALRLMQERFPDASLTEGRKRMARIPEGASLIANPVSAAPGYMIDNVVVMAGIPAIMQAMLEDVLPRLDKGRVVISRTVRVEAGESRVAADLAALQNSYPTVQIGSYPFSEQNRWGTNVVLRSSDASRLEEALAEFWRVISEKDLIAIADPAES